MAKQCLRNEIVHLEQNFLQEDVEDYTDRLKEETSAGSFFRYNSAAHKIDSIDELLLFCEETFECDVVNAYYKRFDKAGDTYSGRQDDKPLLIYSFGSTIEISLESAITDIDEVSLRYVLNSGDILYLPVPEIARIYTATKSKPKKGETFMLFFHTTQPYSRGLHSNSLFSFEGNDFFTDSSPTQAGVISVSQSGNTTNRIIDGNSDYGKAIMKQVSESLKAQGIFLDWD